MEGHSGDGVEVALEAFSQSKPLYGGRLEREVQERVFHLRRDEAVSVFEVMCWLQRRAARDPTF